MGARDPWRRALTIGVGVEGPSDRLFWDKVLHKHFKGVRFDIRNMNNREKLIRETPRLWEAFRGAAYDAMFVLLDRDNTPSVSEILQKFDSKVRVNSQEDLAKRFVFVCVAIRELEAWYLADEGAIRKILPKSDYRSPKETANLNAEKELNRLWHLHYSISLNKIDFAKSVAPHFQANVACSHSDSFSYFWNTISDRIAMN